VDEHETRRALKWAVVRAPFPVSSDVMNPEKWDWFDDLETLYFIADRCRIAFCLEERTSFDGQKRILLAIMECEDDVEKLTWEVGLPDDF
jgi:hypothetical protein